MRLRTLFFTYITLIGLITYAQESPALGEQLDRLSFDWDNEQIELKTYGGLQRFCNDANYRNSIVQLLEDLHHVDSVLYDRAIRASKKSHDHEIKKLIKEIEEFELEYSLKSFLHFLHEECVTQKELEKNSEDLRGNNGIDSYDSQVYMLEVELKKYVKHITKRIDSIRDHAHHLGVK